MSALAELFVRRGVKVTGCDANATGVDDLRRLGVAIKVVTGDNRFVTVPVVFDPRVANTLVGSHGGRSLLDWWVWRSPLAYLVRGCCEAFVWQTT